MGQEDGVLLDNARELDLITTGRKSGFARRVELWHVYEEGYVYLLAALSVLGTPTDWYRNLQALPEAVLRIEGRAISVRNEQLDDPEALADYVLGLFRDKYGPTTMRQWYESYDHLPVKLKVIS